MSKLFMLTLLLSMIISNRNRTATTDFADINEIFVLERKNLQQTIRFYMYKHAIYCRKSTNNAQIYFKLVKLYVQYS